jgi:hypothetical protein
MAVRCLIQGQGQAVALQSPPSTFPRAEVLPQIKSGREPELGLSFLDQHNQFNNASVNLSVVAESKNYLFVAQVGFVDHSAANYTP